MTLAATFADSLRDMGALAAAIAAMIALVAGVSRLRPVRWLWRHLVTDPVAEWFRVQVREELERTNGGSSLYDRVATIERRLEEG